MRVKLVLFNQVTVLVITYGPLGGPGKEKKKIIRNLSSKIDSVLVCVFTIRVFPCYTFSCV